jgi:pimeloyl-ACP methyl ester carboxylesterase
MHAEVISIQTPAEPIDGLFYLPEGPKPRAAALIFHGNCCNFYTGPARFLPEVLVPRGIACLAFNRRGHDMVTSVGSRGGAARYSSGGSFQLNSEGIEDNRLASDWLEGRGFKNPIIIGHSNGGMLAAKHCADNYGNPRALVLMSAHGGGRHLAERMNGAGLFARDRQAELTAQAEAMVAEGRGKELLLLPGWWWVISAESFLDRTRNTPDTVEAAAKICCPSLFLRGAKESAESYPAEKFAANAAAPCEVRILPDCDHWYTGHEQETAIVVAEWLEQHGRLG